MSHPRAAPTALALLLAAGCGRELTLKEPPAPVGVEAPRPRLLGDRAGSYQAFTQVHLQDGSTELRPAGPRVTVMHVENPTPEPLDLLVVQLRPLELAPDPAPPDGMVPEVCTDGSELPAPDLAVGLYDRVGGQTSLSLYGGALDDAAAESELRVDGASLASGGFALDVPFCGRTGEHPVVLQPVCPLQRSLSGVYGGSWGSSPGVTTDVAVGVTGDKLLFVEWPPGGLAALERGGAFAIGRIDPQSETGFFLGTRLSADRPNGMEICGLFQLGRDAGDVRLYAGAYDASIAGGCPFLRDPDPATWPEVHDSFLGSRLLGSPDPACVGTPGLALVTKLQVRTCGGRRVLDVTTHLENESYGLPADLPVVDGAPEPTEAELLADGLYVQVIVEGAGAPLRRMAADDAWPPVTARFELPARAARLLVQTHAMNLFTGESGSSLPSCPQVEGRR